MGSALFIDRRQQDREQIAAVLVPGAPTAYEKLKEGIQFGNCALFAKTASRWQP